MLGATLRGRPKEHLLPLDGGGKVGVREPGYLHPPLHPLPSREGKERLGLRRCSAYKVKRGLDYRKPRTNPQSLVTSHYSPFPSIAI